MPAENFDTFVLATPVAPALGGSEPIPCIQGGVTKQTTPHAIAQFANSLGVADGVLTGTTAPAVLVPAVAVKTWVLVNFYCVNAGTLAANDFTMTFSWNDGVAGQAAARAFVGGLGTTTAMAVGGIYVQLGPGQALNWQATVSAGAPTVQYHITAIKA